MELIDRFGIPPQSGQTTIQRSSNTFKGRATGHYQSDINNNGGYIEFSPDTPVQAISIIQLMQKNPTYYRMEVGSA